MSTSLELAQNQLLAPAGLDENDLQKGERSYALKNPKQADINKQQQPNKHASAKDADELTEDDLPVVQWRRQQQGP